jgi:uncharacterized membrane-anchored protein
LTRATRDCFLALLLLAPATAAAGPDAAQKSPIDWKPGPLVASLGRNAEIQIPEGYLFADAKGTRKLLELTHNIVGGSEVGAIVPMPDSTRDGWFVVFEFREIGYVKDDEKNSIDADALMKSMREGTEAANKERKKRGWTTMELVGWERPPFYDTRTHNLTWAIRGRSEQGGESVNHSIRVLGRRGTMDADLVLSPEQYAEVVPRFDSLITTFRFHEGNRYADFVKGDKVAEYGLAALIAGGAGAIAVKTGLLGNFWKVFVAAALALKKLLVVAVLAIVAFIRRAIAGVRGMFARKDEEITAPPDAPVAASAKGDGGSGSGSAT